MLDFRFVVMIAERRKAPVDPAAAGRQTNFGDHRGQRDKRIKKTKRPAKNSRTSLLVGL
jgi:hypothetical protein